MKNVLVVSAFFLVLSSCSDGLRSTMAGTGVNAVPDTYENPDPNDSSPRKTAPRDQLPTVPASSDLTTSDESWTAEAPLPNQQAPSATPAPHTAPDAMTQSPPASAKPAQKDPSRLMAFAQKIMDTEGRRLGTACNFYVHRVLQAAGFAYVVFMANDFDVYAKRYFKNYKAEDFQVDPSKAEVERLRKYIWSYEERTPFITQWSRSGVHGHIAFVERLGDKLVIYQASLGTKTPRKDQTTPEILLRGYNRRQLTVYSEMTPK